MKNYSSDIAIQVNKVFETTGSDLIKERYELELIEVFSYIYAINYLKNKVELKKYFDSTFFKITYSCLLESYSLILNNYSRGSSLVLRSALENFTKHIIHIVNSEYNEVYPINDRSYSINKTTLEKVINERIKENFKQLSKEINGKMEREYRILSGLSHSLTPESINNTLNYFFDLRNVNDENVSLVLGKLKEVCMLIFSLLVILCEPSFKLWNKDELENILLIVFGRRKTSSYINKIKT